MFPWRVISRYNSVFPLELFQPLEHSGSIRNIKTFFNIFVTWWNQKNRFLNIEDPWTDSVSFLYLCFFFYPSFCPVFITQSVGSMQSQPLSEWRRVHVGPTHGRLPMLLSREIHRDALWAQYARFFPSLFKPISAFFFVWPAAFSKWWMIELWSIWLLSVSHPTAREGAWKESYHDFKTLLTSIIAVISEDVLVKVKAFKLCCTPLSSALTVRPFFHASCLLFRKVLRNHTPTLLWRWSVLGPNTPPERGTVHLCDRGNQVWKSPLHK